MTSIRSACDPKPNSQQMYSAINFSFTRQIRSFINQKKRAHTVSFVQATITENQQINCSVKIV